jgi:hypothetical protein
MKARLNLKKISHNLSHFIQELDNRRNGSGFGSVS